MFIYQPLLIVVATLFAMAYGILWSEEEQLIRNGFDIDQGYSILGPPLVTFNSGKERIADACLPQDGVCTNFTLCTLESIKKHPNGVVVAGHGNYLCLEMYEICCTPDPEAVELAKQQEEKDRKKVADDEHKKGATWKP